MVIQVQGIIARSSLALASLLQKHIRVAERSSAQYHRAEGEIFLDSIGNYIGLFVLNLTLRRGLRPCSGSAQNLLKSLPEGQILLDSIGNYIDLSNLKLCYNYK